MSKIKIFFGGSITGGLDDADLYQQIIGELKNYGTVLTEHNKDLKQVMKGEKDFDDKAIHDRDMDWLTQCDALVAEVTQTSLGVGYEIGRAVAMNKKILCLFRPDSGKRLSAMIAGADNGENFIVKHYKEQDMPQILKEFFQ